MAVYFAMTAETLEQVQSLRERHGMKPVSPALPQFWGAAQEFVRGGLLEIMPVNIKKPDRREMGITQAGIDLINGTSNKLL